jgi:hypothetical protein
VYVEIQFESRDAANTAVEELNGMLKYATGLEFGEDTLSSDELGISWSEAAARRIGDDELKWWPGSPSVFARPPMPVSSKCVLCPKEWLAFSGLAHVPSSSDSQRPEAGIQVE